MLLLLFYTVLHRLCSVVIMIGLSWLSTVWLQPQHFMETLLCKPISEHVAA